MGDRIEALEVENEALRAKLAAWTTSAEVDSFRTDLRLSPQEAQVLSLLVRRRRVSREQIYIAVLERLNGDGPGLQTINVIVFKIRKKLEALGIAPAIRSLAGQGYEITPDTIAAIEQRLSPRLAAA